MKNGRFSCTEIVLKEVEFITPEILEDIARLAFLSIVDMAR